ncbi:MAG TPA: hypothetical protein VGO46_01320 [Gemmatimonadaceae bacterium]|nr:hypothetical protein [Gemmatimonadaceae bacterium]
MPEPIAEHLTSPQPSGEGASTAAAFEPAWALLVGGAAGAVGFFLFALFVGAKWAIAIAAAAAIVAFARRERIASFALLVAGALSAIALVPSTTALFIAALAFGAGLALAAREYARRHASALVP